MAGIDTQTAFHVDAVRFAVAERTLLGPVSPELERPRVYGPIGHNGSGKSTLVKLAMQNASVIFQHTDRSEERQAADARHPAEIMRGDMLQGIFGMEMGVFAHPVTGQAVGYM